MPKKKTNTLKNKGAQPVPDVKNPFLKDVTFVALIQVKDANPNGDINYMNRPRVDDNNFGVISPESVVYKVKRRMARKGHVLLGSDGLSLNQGTVRHGVKAKAESIGIPTSGTAGAVITPENLAKMQDQWIDMRLFGEVLTWCNFGIPRAISMNLARSTRPVTISEFSGSRSYTGMSKESEAGKLDFSGRSLGGKKSDSLNTYAKVDYGLYLMPGAVKGAGCKFNRVTEEDIEVFKESLRGAFDECVSRSKPAGSMKLVSLIWIEPKEDAERDESGIQEFTTPLVGDFERQQGAMNALKKRLTELEEERDADGTSLNDGITNHLLSLSEKAIEDEICTLAGCTSFLDRVTVYSGL